MKNMSIIYDFHEYVESLMKISQCKIRFRLKVDNNIQYYKRVSKENMKYELIPSRDTEMQQINMIVRV